ncbi:MAG TPA: 50S ribosomal protein L21e [archaeon]|nr:50S ribosomal protein L21e [archaeon]
MVQKSYGKMRGSRKKLMNPPKPTLTDMLRKFKVGDKVHVVLRSSGSFQHPRTHGKTGTVIAKNARTYVVEVRDGSLMKRYQLAPEHLKLSG